MDTYWDGMKHDDANIHGGEEMPSLPNKFQAKERAIWEACARAYGHTDNAEMWEKYQIWQQAKILEDIP